MRTDAGADENAVFQGPPGVGKTHLAVGLAMQARCNGMMVSL
ncbi:ATP-binding protein [Caproicibacter fermentans]